MTIDRLISETKRKKCPCVVGLDPEWSKIPDCYKQDSSSVPEVILRWAKEVIDCVAAIVPAVKPQMAFYEVYGAAGVNVFEQIAAYAHERELVVIDDSKRNDIGNTAKAYAFAHLSDKGPINADFLTVSPFLGSDSIQPFIDMSREEGKGLFVLVKTSNPSSVEISEARNDRGETISEWLASYLNTVGETCMGENGYSVIGAVVGATFPKEAKSLRRQMKNNYFLVPGYGAQGGSAGDIVHCFNEDGLGAIVNSSRGILYHHLQTEEYDGSREQYLEIVRTRAIKMQKEIYAELKCTYPSMTY